MRHREPRRRIYLASHPSIHLAIDSDELTSDPLHPCPMTALPLSKPPDPFTHLCNQHPPPQTSIDIRSADTEHVSNICGQSLRTTAGLFSSLLTYI